MCEDSEQIRFTLHAQHAVEAAAVRSIDGNDWSYLGSSEMDVGTRGSKIDGCQNDLVGCRTSEGMAGGISVKGG